MDTTTKPSILVISSMVADGSVGGRVVSFALERLGFPTWFVPTVTLPRHPGRVPSVRTDTPEALFEGLLADMVLLSKSRPVAAILTGYIGYPRQAKLIADAIAEIRKTHPDLLHLCDPVLGDQVSEEKAGLYIAEETAKAIREKLWNICDIATPNVFELNWLCSTGLANIQNQPTPDTIKSLAANAAPDTIAVTSVPGLMNNHIGNLMVRGDNPALLFEHLAMRRAPHGTGDLFAALLLGHLLLSDNLEVAMERASSCLFELTARAAKSGLDDLPIIAEQATLERPMAMIAKRIIGAAKPKPIGTKKRVVFKPSAL
ncbi:MAG: bifunctional hydroxymethylpyrimidine kinase/phosphomethylpyrimidine kinase [Hyphomicrobiales bacterium]